MFTLHMHPYFIPLSYQRKPWEDFIGGMEVGYFQQTSWL